MIDLENVSSYINDRTRPENTVHFGKTKRFEKAENLLKNPGKKGLKDRNKIIELTCNFLEMCGFDNYFQIYKDIIKIDVIGDVTIFLDAFNKDTKKKYGLNNEKDIVWLKFAKNGFLGVVASSNDINFNYLSDAKDYDERIGPRKWKYNTSGIILHHLKNNVGSLESGCEWDTSFFLVFPLPGIEKKQRHLIETGIGNYLLENGVIILDYYSHRI